MDVIEKIDSLSKAERDFICTLLFHTINWFREVTEDASQTGFIDQIPVTVFVFLLRLFIGHQFVLSARRYRREDEGGDPSAKHHLPSDSVGEGFVR